MAEGAGAGWQACSPATVGGFSAVAYFFGRSIHQQYHAPVGLLASSWGGTPSEAWMSPESLRAFPESRPRVAKFIRPDSVWRDE